MTLDKNDLRYIKLMLIANGSESAKRIAAKIFIEEEKVVQKKPKHQPIKPSTKPYRTKPDYKPWSTT